MSNTEQLLTSAVGATIGFFVGGPAGAFTGFQYGLLAGSVLFPADLPSVQGPRLEDFERLHADPGSPIAQVFGTCAVPGFRMYLGPVEEIATTEEVGGKGAPSQDVTTFMYRQTLALGLCEGPIAGILRVWENGQLVYDVRPQQEGESDEAYAARIEMSEVYETTFTLYLGDEDQEADPTLETEQGAGNVPGFRGLAYIVFPNRELKQEQGNRHPVFKIEVATIGEAPEPELDIRKIADVDNWTAGTGNGARFVGNGLIREQLVSIDRTNVGGVWGHRWRQRTFDIGGTQQGGTVSHFVAAPLQFQFDTHNAYPVENSGSIWMMVHAPGSFRRWAVGETLADEDFELPSGHAFPSAGPRPFLIPGHGVYQITGSGSMGPAFGKWLTRWPYPALVDGESPGILADTVKIKDEALNTGGILFAGVDRDNWIWLYDSNTRGFFRVSTNLGTVEAVDGLTLPNTTPAQSVRVTQRGPYGIYGHQLGSNFTVFDLDTFETLGTFNAAETELFAQQRAIPIIQDVIYYPSLDKLWQISDMVEGEISRASIGFIIRRVCARVGLEESSLLIDTELDERTVHGYSVARETSALAALEQVRMVGMFDYVESAGKLAFRIRGREPVATFSLNDLGVVEIDGQPVPRVITRKLQDVELPRQIRLRYPSVARDYEIGEQLSPARIGTVGVNDVSVDCSVVLDDDAGARIAEILFREAWASATSQTFQVGPEWHALEPADVALLPVDGRLYRVRIVSIDDAGLLIRRIAATRDDNGSYVSIAVATRPPRPKAVLELIGDTSILLLDIPALREEDDNAGFYLAAWRTGVGQSWTGARIYRSVDDGASYQPIAAIGAQATVGTVSAAPAEGDGYTWDDEGSILVTLEHGELESRTDAAVLSGANAAAIGANGRWQIVQFANAELVSGNTYRLTRLLLGRRGTEHLIGTTQNGDRFVLVSGPGIYRMPLQTAEIGAVRLYRGVTVGLAFDDAESESFTGEGMALECFSPAYVEGDRDTNGDLTISWFRRDRLAQPLRDGVPLGMSEAELKFEVDIIDDSTSETVLRTLVTTDEEVTYTAAQQTEDFGSPQSEITVRVYQISATVGRGIPAEAIV